MAYISVRWFVIEEPEMSNALKSFALFAAVSTLWGGTCFAAAGSATPAAAPPPVAVSGVVAEAGADYVLGSADKLRLTVYGEPSLTGEYLVSSTGTVSLPLAGDVVAAGRTLGDFRDNVVKALKEGYLKDPKVSIEVLTFRPFYILGEVTKPGQYPYTSGLTVFNAVATAGGFTYRANTRKVFIKHANDGGEKELPLTAETIIAPGDTVRIPERFF
jgi:protein involved in polysaccharide export with SLBB domain